MKKKIIMAAGVAVLSIIVMMIGAQNVSAQYIGNDPTGHNRYHITGRVRSVSGARVLHQLPAGITCQPAGELAGQLFYNSTRTNFADIVELTDDATVAFVGDELYLCRCVAGYNRLIAIATPAPAPVVQETPAPTPAPTQAPPVINVTVVMPPQQQQQQQQTIVAPAPAPVAVAKEKGVCNPEGKLKRFLSAVGYGFGGAGIGRATQGKWGAGSIIGGIGGGVGGAVLGPCYGGVGSLAGLSGFAFDDKGKNPLHGLRGGRENGSQTWQGQFVPAASVTPSQTGPPLVISFTPIGHPTGSGGGNSGNGSGGPRP